MACRRGKSREEPECIPSFPALICASTTRGSTQCQRHIVTRGGQPIRSAVRCENKQPVSSDVSLSQLNGPNSSSYSDASQANIHRTQPLQRSFLNGACEVTVCPFYLFKLGKGMDLSMLLCRSSKQLNNVSSSGGCSSRSTQRRQTRTHIMTPSETSRGNGMIVAPLLFFLPPRTFSRT